MRLWTPTLATLPAAALLTAGQLLLLASAQATPHPTGAREGSVGAADLLAKVTSCTQISRGRYRTDTDARATIPVCDKKGAVFWKADMDIDCDGRPTAKCNKTTDPWFQPDTAFHQSDGRPLRSDTLPYVVVPETSGIWNPAAAGIKGGAVAAVVYGSKVQYAVVGDTGPTKIIGEASYATAQALGIDPDPAKGGTGSGSGSGSGSGVTYILFRNSEVSPIESHQAAVTLGERLAKQFLRDN